MLDHVNQSKIECHNTWYGQEKEWYEAKNFASEIIQSRHEGCAE
jgi:hypothetical protein